MQDKWSTPPPSKPSPHHAAFASSDAWSQAVGFHFFTRFAPHAREGCFLELGEAFFIREKDLFPVFQLPPPSFPAPRKPLDPIGFLDERFARGDPGVEANVVEGASDGFDAHRLTFLFRKCCTKRLRRELSLAIGHKSLEALTAFAVDQRRATNIFLGGFWGSTREQELDQQFFDDSRWCWLLLGMTDKLAYGNYASMLFFVKHLTIFGENWSVFLIQYKNESKVQIKQLVKI